MYWAEKMPQLVKILLALQAQGLEFDPRTHAKTNLAAVESSAREVGLGAHWPATLTYMVCSKPVRGLVSKQGGWRLRNSI